MDAQVKIDDRVKAIKVPSNAVGFVEVKHPKISIQFERALFERINANARHHGISFAEEVRQMVRWAFAEDDKRRRGD